MRPIEMKTVLLAGAFSLLSVVAALGWTRTPQPIGATPQQLTQYPSIAPRAGYYTAKASRTAVRRVYSARSAAPSYASESYVKPRSTKKSIVIVAGRAGVEAAIAQGFTARY